MPRPFHIDPSLGLIKVGGKGFPSGACQTTVILSGNLITTWRSWISYLVSFLYIFSIAFSRVYLGVHYLVDVLGGFTVGLILFGIYQILFPIAEKQLENRSFYSILSFQVLLTVAVLLMFPFFRTYLRIFSSALGLTFGLILTKQFSWPESKRKLDYRCIIDVLLAVFGTFITYYMTTFFKFSPFRLYIFVQYFIVGIWLSPQSHSMQRHLNKLFCYLFIKASLSI